MAITQVGTLIVPVADQDRALDFYVGTLGFTQTVDFSYAGGVRWLEVTPTPGTPGIALASVEPAPPVETGIALGSTDVEADHADLKARGVDVDAAIVREGDPIVRWAGAALAGTPPMFRFRDPDGNSFLVVQAG
jgi:catechol 2,3-dioxygenase-like lactoylglutathione lyase family enzyme